MKYLTVINFVGLIFLVGHMLRDKPLTDTRLKAKLEAIESVVIDHDSDINKIKKKLK